jgi:hypothetical protein
MSNIDHSPYIQGEFAANAGAPYTANPFPKPDRPETGANYPGDWSHWMAGWTMQSQRLGKDVTAARVLQAAFIARGI